MRCIVSVIPFKPNKKNSSDAVVDNRILFRQQGFLLVECEKTRSKIKLVREKNPPESAWFSLVHTTFRSEGGSVTVLTFTELGKAIDVFEMYVGNHPTLDKGAFLEIVKARITPTTVYTNCESYILN